MTPIPSTTALGKLMVLSPHLDDGVFSCAELLSLVSGATVVTICAAVPPFSDALPEWDAAAGFVNAQQAMAARREEDRQALALLHAQPYWLDFCDSQYGAGPDAVRVAAALAVAMHAQHPDSVLMPAGLFHADHRLTHRAALMARRDFAHLNWFMYEDALYRRVTGLLQQRLAVLRESASMRRLLRSIRRATARPKHVRCVVTPAGAGSTRISGGRCSISAPCFSRRRRL